MNVSAVVSKILALLYENRASVRFAILIKTSYFEGTT